MDGNRSAPEMGKLIEMARAVKALDLKREERSLRLAEMVLNSMSDDQVDRALKMLDALSQPQSHGSPKE